MSILKSLACLNCWRTSDPGIANDIAKHHAATESAVVRLDGRQQEEELAPAAASRNWASFSDLDSDVLHIIIKLLFLSGGDDDFDPDRDFYRRRQLISLSQVDKRMRSECLPLIFRSATVVIHKHKGYKGFYPPRIWRYLKAVHVDDWSSTIDPTIVYTFLSELITALPQLHSLATFSIKLRSTVPSDLIRALGSVQTLSVLKLAGDFWPTEEQLPFDVLCNINLERLQIDAPRVPYKRDVATRAREVRTASPLLRATSATLRDLIIPGHLTDFELVGELDWPSLRTLTFTGHTPPKPQPSLASLIRGMPKLQELHFRFIGPESSLRGGTGGDYVVQAQIDFETKIERLGPVPHVVHFILSPKVDIVNAAYEREQLGTLLPGLRALTVSNISSDDQFFHYLPQNLLELNILALPQKNWDLGWTPISYPLSSAKAITIVQALAPLRLQKLHLTLAGRSEPDLIRVIAENVPTLLSLYLEQEDYYDEEPSDSHAWDSYALAVGPLRLLKDLRLSVSFSDEYPGLSDMHQPERVKLRRELSFILARQLPELEVIGFQQVRDSGGLRNKMSYPEWCLLSVFRDKDGTPDIKQDVVWGEATVE